MAAILYIFLIVIITLTMETSSTPQSFFKKLEKRIEEIDSHLCVGLDPHIKELFPGDDAVALASKTESERCDAAFTFCKNLIDTTGMCFFY